MVRTLDTIGAGLNVTTVHQDPKPASPEQCTGDVAAVTPIQTTISG